MPPSGRFRTAQCAAPTSGGILWGGRVRAPAPTAYPKVRLILCRARCPHRAVSGRPSVPPLRVGGILWSRSRWRFDFFFAMEKEGCRPQAAKYPAHNERNPNPAPSSGPLGHLSLSPLAFGHLPLTRGSRPPGGRQNERAAAKIPPKNLPLSPRNFPQAVIQCLLKKYW